MAVKKSRKLPGLVIFLQLRTVHLQRPGYGLCFTRFGAFHLEVRDRRHRFRHFFIYFFFLLFDTRRKIMNKDKFTFIFLACPCFTCIVRNLASEELLRQVLI